MQVDCRKTSLSIHTPQSTTPIRTGQTFGGKPQALESQPPGLSRSSTPQSRACGQSCFELKNNPVTLSNPNYVLDKTQQSTLRRRETGGRPKDRVAESLLRGCVCDVILRGQMMMPERRAGEGERSRRSARYSVVGSMCVVCCEKESGGDHQ